MAIQFPYHEKGNFNFACLVDAVADGVDCVSLQVFTIRQLAHLPCVGNCTASFYLPYSVGRVEYSEIAICTLRSGALDCSHPSLDRMPYADIQRLTLN